jgi:hypothetical protein
MELARRIGIGIIMIIPTFVGGGAVWAIFHNWFAALVWVVIMAVISGAIISGKYIKSWESRKFRLG